MVNSKVHKLLEKVLSFVSLLPFQVTSIPTPFNTFKSVDANLTEKLG
jgi:hypothetical protein